MSSPSSAAYRSSEARFELGVVREELVVHLPELALPAGGLGGQRGRHGVVVKRQWVVAKHQGHVGPVGLEQRLERGVDPRRKRTLKVAELDERDQRQRAAARWGVEGGDAVDGRAGGRRGPFRHRRLGPGEQRGVEVVAPDAPPQQVVGAGQLIVDDLLEGGDRLRAR